MTTDAPRLNLGGGQLKRSRSTSRLRAVDYVAQQYGRGEILGLLTPAGGEETADAGAAGEERGPFAVSAVAAGLISVARNAM